VLLFDQAPEFSWNFEATFDIDTCCVISSQHNFEPDERAGGWPKGKVVA